MLRQNWIAESVNVCWRPRLPLAGAYHRMSLSSQIVNDPRALSAALYVAQLVVLQRVLGPWGSLMHRGYRFAQLGLCNKATEQYCVETRSNKDTGDLEMESEVERFFAVPERRSQTPRIY